MATPGGQGRPTPAQFVVWVFAGAALAMVLLGAFTAVSYVAAAATVVLVALALRLRGANSSALGAVVGVAACLLYVAWLNRAGPGEVCTTDAMGGETCTQEWSPWPWLLIGFGLAVAATGGFLGVLRHK